MRLGIGLALIMIAQGCASQSGATDRRLHEQAELIKRLSANCDRLEERIIALEAAIRSGSGGVHRPQDTNAERPELPVVKVVPNGQKADTFSDTDMSTEGAVEDSQRLTIVGEGSRVEARTAAESTAAARQSAPAKSRASKGNQGSFSPASTGGASK